MITARRIKDLLAARPFKPFQLYLSDGGVHRVPHPEFAWVFGGTVFVGQSGNGGESPADRVSELSLLHVTRIERGRKPARR